MAIEWHVRPRVEPSTYPAYVRHAKQYWDKFYKAWVCLIVFELLSEDQSTVLAQVPRFLRLGQGEKPRAAPRSSYLAEWVKANRAPPLRGDRLSPRVFVGATRWSS